MSTASRNCRNRVQRLRGLETNATKPSGSFRLDPRTLRPERLKWLNNPSGKHWKPCDLGLCKSKPEAKTAASRKRKSLISKGSCISRASAHQYLYLSNSTCGREARAGDIPSTFFPHPEVRIAYPCASKGPSPKGAAMKKISTRKNTPYISDAPWSGFSALDWPREKPLPRCPAPRCRRARQCLAAHDGLYCRRTHLSAPEIEAMRRESALSKAIALVPPVFDPDDLQARLDRAAQIAELRKDHHAGMTARWKAGEFDHLYGKYAKAGRLMKPPPRLYQEYGQKRAGDL